MRVTATRGIGDVLGAALDKVAAQAGLERIVRDAKQGAPYEEFFPLLFVVVRDSRGGIRAADLKPFLAKLASKGVKIEDEGLAADLVVLAQTATTSGPAQAPAAAAQPSPWGQMGQGAKQVGQGAWNMLQNVGQGVAGFFGMAPGAQATKALDEAIRVLDALPRSVSLSQQAQGNIRALIVELSKQKQQMQQRAPQQQQQQQQQAPQQAAPTATMQTQTTPGAPAAVPTTGTFSGQPA